MASSLGFQRGNVRPRDGFHNSVNREDRQRLQERQRQGHDIGITIGRWVLPRTRSKGSRTPSHPVAEFVERMGYGHNRQFGEAVSSECLVLQYVSPNMMANLFDCYQGSGSKRSNVLTPRGRKQQYRVAKKDMQQDFRNEQHGLTNRELEMRAGVSRRIFDGKKSGTVELAIARTPEVEEIILRDLEIINSVVSKRLSGAPEIGFNDLSLRIPVFTIDEKHRNQDIEIAIPLLPMGLTTFQPLGIHEIPRL